jgi:hypothetical protein
VGGEWKQILMGYAKAGVEERREAPARRHATNAANAIDAADAEDAEDAEDAV